ncbi:hypothetical protein [Gordonia rubripertincta]|uniref:hypothetical protein n=1 Tax=Gordonia rubripertincta TaxID=36822 RepID=UPI000B8D75A7|nr:hypothetical protein [Gordonia rubripertincta]ASR04013.1 hypothetical protein GCWB2_16140 [Gordonia rubripertincta]
MAPSLPKRPRPKRELPPIPPHCWAKADALIYAADPISTVSFIDEADNTFDHDVRLVLRALLHRLRQAVEHQRWRHPERIERGKAMARHAYTETASGRPPSRDSVRAGQILSCALSFTGPLADSLEEAVAFDFLDDYVEWTMRIAPQVIVAVTGGILDK